MSAKPHMNELEPRLRELIDQLRAEGWHVETEPDPKRLPGALRGTRVDFLARRNDEIVIGEVAARGTARQEQIDALAERVAAVPNARLEVYWTGDTPIVNPDPEEVRHYIVEASLASRVSLRAALLMALAAFEGAVAAFADEVGIRLRVPSRQLLSNLYSLGYVDEADFNRLSALYTLRSAVAHLATSQVPKQGDIEFCLDLAKRMLDGHYIAADQMIEWFQERYERPELHTPFETREGGYLYQDDEPHDAEDVLRDEFPYASEQAITDAVRWLEGESNEWVRKVRPEDSSGETEA